MGLYGLQAKGGKACGERETLSFLTQFRLIIQAKRKSSSQAQHPSSDYAHISWIIEIPVHVHPLCEKNRETPEQILESLSFGTLYMTFWYVGNRLIYLFVL